MPLGMNNSSPDMSTNNRAATPLLLATQIHLISSTTVSGALFGFAFAIFCLYVYSIVPRLQDGGRKRQSQVMLGYSSVIMLSGLCFLVSNTWVIQDAYIEHSDYPGGPLLYISLNNRAPYATTISFSCQTAVDLLTSAIQVCRQLYPYILS
jgi:hypothetical protein